MTHTPDASPGGTDSEYRLPNGEVIHHRHRYETDFIYREIFVHRIYAKNGITLPPNACVVDVGGNIGLFSLFVKLECPTARVYLFEPARELFRLAEHNLARFGDSVRLFPVGVGDSDKTIEFTYYPEYSILSGFHAAPDQDREVLEQGARNQLLAATKNRVPVTQKMVDAAVGKKLEGAERYPVPVTSLSSFLESERIETVDLLKIDAERCEQEIFAGLAPADYRKLRQIVVEAHDRVTAAELDALLTSHGFAVTMEQESQFDESEVMNLYAIREAP